MASARSSASCAAEIAASASAFSAASIVLRSDVDMRGMVGVLVFWGMDAKRMQKAREPYFRRAGFQDSLQWWTYAGDLPDVSTLLLRCVLVFPERRHGGT